VIGFILKASIALTFSYIFLSFQINGKHLFDHINDFTGPVGENIQESLGVAVSNTWEKSKDVGGKLFTNSKPKIRAIIQDSKRTISNKISEKKVQAEKKVEEEFLEDLKKEEISHLDSIIENEK
jgi:hypothetical protein